LTWKNRPGEGYDELGVIRIERVVNRRDLC